MHSSLGFFPPLPHPVCVPLQILYRVEHILKRLLLEQFYKKYGGDSPERDPAKLKHYYLVTMRDLRLSDVVDTIAGTSTGAIMAGYLAAQVGGKETNAQSMSERSVSLNGHFN